MATWGWAVSLLDTWMTVMSPAGLGVHLSRGWGNICFPPKHPPLVWKHPGFDPQSGCEKTFLILVPSGRLKTSSWAELWIKNVNRKARFWGFFPFKIFHHCHTIDYAKKCKLFLFKHHLESSPEHWKVPDGRGAWRYLLNHPHPPMVIGCIISPCQTHRDCHLSLANSSHLVDLTLSILSWEAEFSNHSCYYDDDFPIYLDIHVVSKG